MAAGCRTPATPPRAHTPRPNHHQLAPREGVREKSFIPWSTARTPRDSSRSPSSAMALECRPAEGHVGPPGRGRRRSSPGAARSGAGARRGGEVQKGDKPPKRVPWPSRWPPFCRGHRRGHRVHPLVDGTDTTRLVEKPFLGNGARMQAGGGPCRASRAWEASFVSGAARSSAGARRGGEVRKGDNHPNGRNLPNIQPSGNRAARQGFRVACPGTIQRARCRNRGLPGASPSILPPSPRPHGRPRLRGSGVGVADGRSGNRGTPRVPGSLPGRVATSPTAQLGD
jgi:hypothetical protein